MYSPRDGRFEGTFSRQDPQGESLDSATERQGQYFSRSIRPAWKSPESAQQAPSRQRDLLSTSSVIGTRSEHVILVLGIRGKQGKHSPSRYAY